LILRGKKRHCTHAHTGGGILPLSRVDIGTSWGLCLEPFNVLSIGLLRVDDFTHTDIDRVRLFFGRRPPHSPINPHLWRLQERIKTLQTEMDAAAARPTTETA
jgi:hypothetical protein